MDIVGQGHIVRTLMNAVRAERIHQAYLFTGSRGIGKTSIARIFAKAVRCPNAKWETEDGAESLKSCDACPSCKEIALGNSVDVIEIDGASNNGVDAVREIRENAKYLPSSGNRKIYIIDEVHMLTTAAFNALLKTLEEPPAHVIFIFATTEPHKIPATILSRTQRFDFRRPTTAQIHALLNEVTQAEKIEAAPAALALIARAAEGSLRDGMSLLDQVIAFAGNQISVGSVRESIGLIEGATLLAVLEGILARNPLEALKHVEQAYQQGHDLRVLTRGLIEFLHATILAKIGSPAPASMELAEEEWKDIQRIAQLRELEEMELIFQVFHHGAESIARSPQPKIVLDVLVVKCASAEALVSFTVETAAPRTPEASPAIRTHNPAAPTVLKALDASALNAPPALKPAMPAATPPVTMPATLVAPVTIEPLKSAAKSWEGFVEHVRVSRPLLASILEHGTCTTDLSKSNDLEVSYRTEDGYFREQLQARSYSEQLTALIRGYFGDHMRFKVEVKDGGESQAARRERELHEREAKAREAVKNHPIIAEARALFGGELGPIELPGDDDGGGA